MKICVASESKGGLNDTVSMQFGRCPIFTVVEVEGNEIRNAYAITNPGTAVASGAGIQAGQAVVNEGCNVVIAGAIGPNSAQVLAMGGVDTRMASAMTVEEAVERFLHGELPRAQVTGGPGMGMGRGRGMGRGHGGGRGRGMGSGRW